MIGFILLFSLLALYRAGQGLYLLVYQRNIRTPHRWTMDFDAIPSKAGSLFLGRGFAWTTKHTQRLRETQSPSAAKYLAKANASKDGLNELSQSGRIETHGVELRERSIWMNLADRVGHTLVLGTTRVGKTRLAELLITQDIHHGDVVIVFDPKGDVDLLRRMIAEAKRCDRLDDLQVFHLGYPKHSCRYNAIGRFDRITEVATRIANQLPSGGNSTAFKEFAWRFVNIIAGALVALSKTPNYELIRRSINDIEPLFVEYATHFLHKHAPEGWTVEIKQRLQKRNPKGMIQTMHGRDPEALVMLQYIQELDLYDPVLDGLMSAYKYDRTYFDKIVSSVGPLMEKLTTGAVAQLISPSEDADDDPRPTLNWLDVIQQGRIVYVGLDALSDSTVASAVGNSMFADLVSVAGHIYKFGVGDSQKKPRVSLHADEFNELIGEEFVPLLNKAGGAGFAVTAYTQTWSDVESQIGSRAKAGQVAGNFNSLIMMRVRELATADMLIDQLPKTAVVGKSTSSGAGDSSKQSSDVDFETSHSDSLSKSVVPLISSTDVFTLPRGHAFALLDGGRLWKLRLPLPSADDQFLPRTIEDALAEFGEADTQKHAEPEIQVEQDANGDELEQVDSVQSG